MSTADPLAAALRVVLNRRGQSYVKDDDLRFARQVREVAQICWMHAGEPGRLREEDADRAEACRELLNQRAESRVKYARANKDRAAQKRRGRKGLRLVPPQS
jgi:hypothetical protein